MPIYDIIVAGAGPAGLMTAITAAQNSASVLLLEKKKSCGNKFLITGQGRCNITSAKPIADFITAFFENGKFLFKAFHKFTPDNLLEYFEARGINFECTDKDKYFPCNGHSAKDLLTVLLNDCYKLGVEQKSEESVVSVTKNIGSDLFIVKTISSEYFATKFVISTGGKSYPGTGSSGDGYMLAQSLGHTVVLPKPALSPLRSSETICSLLSGVTLKNICCTLINTIDGRKLGKADGDLLFSHTGLTGPAPMTLSRFLPADTENMKFRIEICLLPGFKKEALISSISSIFRAAPNVGVIKHIASEFSIPLAFVHSVFKKIQIPSELKSAQLSNSIKSQIAEALLSFPIEITGSAGFSEAMITKGGIPVNEINPTTMESLICPGLYFAGEVIDIDAITGGFNLQAAFSTAFLAGINASASCEDIC